MPALGQLRREEGHRILKYDHIGSIEHLRRLYFYFLENKKLFQALIECFSYVFYTVIYLQ